MISAVIHTYNEEKNIERCLSSLAWVDERIIIDMGSTDRTCDKAQQFKAKIFSHPYTGFVEPARNFGLSKAKGDWIFIIDADEEIPKNLANRLLVETQKSSYDYYRIARKNIIFGKWIKHTGWWPDYQVRFFRRGAVSWTEKIHGVPLTKGQGIDIEVSGDMHLIHYHYQGLDQYINRMNRYTTISSKDLFVSNYRFKKVQLFEMPIREFINRYFIWEGYKDGIHGLALSLLQSFSELITYLKLWELENFIEEKITLAETEKIFSKESRSIQHWLINCLLQQPHNLFEEMYWRLKRKLNFHG
ncbi:glycosyltransferase family 2 protein [Candidatus Gottesmanbacteria bacterium]|nr:glycosyltransferase family 2 protein [Candidatus Gottesmanbacteria bacterium]